MNKTETTKGSPQLLGVSTNRITTEMAGSVPDTITDIAGFTPKPPPQPCVPMQVACFRISVYSKAIVLESISNHFGPTPSLHGCPLRAISTLMLQKNFQV